jgi:hypothetical protein
MSIVPTNYNIAVSGSAAVLDGISWPSGQFDSGTPGSNLGAFLASVSATFGFNLTPHSFSLGFIPYGAPDAFHGASGQLPPIGHFLTMTIGEFFLHGRITHADYIHNAQGTIVNVNVEDDRKTLRRTKIHTEDLGGSIPSGVISVAHAYREINGLLDVNNLPSDPLVAEYRRILEIGATYQQILEAIDLGFTQDKTPFSASDFPSVAKLESNIGSTINDLRFQFNLTPLDEAFSRILQDAGYDWYWNMGAAEINLANKKDVFDIDESDILELVSFFGSVSGLNETSQISFGQDANPEPTRFRVLGGHQEGILNSRLLSPIDGLDTHSIDRQDGTVANFGGIVFRKIWDQLTIGFYDAGGFYRTYIPGEKELQLALAGIEQWSYFKKFQTASPAANPPGYGLPADDGSVAAQDTTFQSRLDPLMPLAGEATSANSSGIRIISNRRDENYNWVLAFYNRVRDHASRHYGRSYVASGILYNEGSGFYRVIDAAWCNVENQIEGFPLSQSGVPGPFVEDYEINRDLGPVSPFLTDDYRIAAHCVLPANTVYGPQGDDVPASFSNWTEDAPPFNPTGDGSHYIPVELSVVGQRIINPRDDDLYSFERFPEGTIWCQLPINAGSDRGIDGTIRNLATLVSTNTKLSGSGLLDIINPGTILSAYSRLSGVAIPVEARIRYGQLFPTQWVAGNMHYQQAEEVQLDDQFVPWAFFPQGVMTSINVMNSRAMSRVRANIVNSSDSRFADFTQVGLPLISFDTFAEQGIGPSGLYGEFSHGVNELSIQFGDQGFSTRYKIASYYPRFGKDAPLGERVRGILNGIINPIDFAFLQLGRQSPDVANNPFIEASPGNVPVFFDTEQRAVRVRITSVANVFSLSSTPPPVRERYRGIDRNGYTKPFQSLLSSDPDFSEGAVCVDGFLNIGDEALYHTDSFEQPGGAQIFRYFTGGRPFGNSVIVEVAQTNGSNYDVTIVDPTMESFGITRAILDVPVLNGTVNVGDFTTLAVQGNAAVAPGAAVDNGLFINGTAGGGAGVSPVMIIRVNDQGTLNATAVCQELDSNGNLTGFALDSNNDVVQGSSFGNTFSGTLILPFPQFATSGQKGFLTTASVPNASTGSGVNVNFVSVVTPAYLRYN